jgi:hypothetical protein
MNTGFYFITSTSFSPQFRPGVQLPDHSGSLTTRVYGAFLAESVR